MEQYATFPQIDSLLTEMRHEAHKAKKLRKMRRGVVCLIVATHACFLLFESVTGFHQKQPYLIVIITTISILYTYYASLINTEKRQKLVKQLANIEDKQACGAMADVLGFEDFELKKIAREALKILLPRLQATDADLLTTTQRQHLYGIFKGQDAELTLILLHALQQVGDMRDWNAVQTLANSKPNKKGQPTLEVIQAAQECLPFLQANAERQEVQQTLLRASNGDTKTPEVLLRPAYSSSSEPQQLLRAGLSAGHFQDEVE